MEKTKACHCECNMSSGHSFGQKRLIPLGVSKSVVIASDRTGLSICRARIERSNLLPICRSQLESKRSDRFFGESDWPCQFAGPSLSEAISSRCARVCRTAKKRFL